MPEKEEFFREMDSHLNSSETCAKRQLSLIHNFKIFIMLYMFSYYLSLIKIIKFLLFSQQKYFLFEIKHLKLK